MENATEIEQSWRTKGAHWEINNGQYGSMAQDLPVNPEIGRDMR